MNIERHISNLKQYIKDDEIIEKDGSDFANFCKGHIDGIQAVLNYIETMHKEFDRLEGIEDNTAMLKQELIEAKEHNRQLAVELEKKDKRISDLEFALMDMVLQFADESKNKINTMGLSALEIAFSELDFDDPMPIKEVHKRYKKLAQEFYK